MTWWCQPGQERPSKVQAQAVLEFAVVVLDAPADLGQTDQICDRGAGWQVAQPVVGGRLGLFRLLDQQPAVGQDAIPPALFGQGGIPDRSLDGVAGRVDTHGSKAGP
ncbi:hypothetical protein GCM10010250_65970 [Streptomyces althioticus]|nr:hypothetical protein GCM10010250_65970 [Streptomyces althioticus]